MLLDLSCSVVDCFLHVLCFAEALLPPVGPHMYSKRLVDLPLAMLHEKACPTSRIMFLVRDLQHATRRGSDRALTLSAPSCTEPVNLIRPSSSSFIFRLRGHPETLHVRRYEPRRVSVSIYPLWLVEAIGCGVAPLLFSCGLLHAFVRVIDEARYDSLFTALRAAPWIV